MKNIVFKILILISFFLILSCSLNKNNTHNFEVVKEFKATVTVGGFVGIEERIFPVGQVYEGNFTSGNKIKIRIAEHTERNEDCPNSWCYQEFLEVPDDHLKLLDD